MVSFAYAQDIKQPNAAGQFYPKDKPALSNTIDRFLDNAAPKAIDEKIEVLISPHAGYEYSGQVAAFGYKVIKGKSYDTVIILGPSHFVDFPGVAVYPEGKFRTPLGDVEIDSGLTRELVKNNSIIKSDLSAFEREHSLEVQIPFLQKVLTNFKIVPLLISNIDFSGCLELAESLNKASKDKNVLIVASTDMSHYHTYNEAVSMDSQTVSVIKGMDAYSLWNKARNGEVELCGLSAVVVALLYAKNKGLDNIAVLKYANSGDATGDYSKVVGYMSTVIYKGENQMLNDAQRKRLLQIARDSIQTFLKTHKKLEVKESDPALTAVNGAFVTLRKHGDLRGCIGNLTGKAPLYLTVRDMAIEAAVSDPRFSALTPEELNQIKIEISVLSSLKRIQNTYEIVMGRHGVLVKRGFNSGVFLPQVATETGWSKEQFLSNLCAHKAGLPQDAWKDKSTEVYIFSAQVFGEE